MRLENAFAYAKACKHYYKENNLKLASRYYHLIFKLPLDFVELNSVLNMLTDNEVYDITDYMREKYYRAIGY